MKVTVVAMVAVAITKKRPQPCITLIPLPDMCAEEKEEEEEEEEGDRAGGSLEGVEAREAFFLHVVKLSRL